jgi:CRP/FNR family transcriptional regulator
MALDPVSVLQETRLFSKVGTDSLKKLSQLAITRKYPKGRRIFGQGEPTPGVFIVARGFVRLYKIAPNGKEHVLHLAGPGDTFAEAAVLGDFPCPAFAEAVEKSECILLPTQPFLAALREDPDLCLQLSAGMAMWVRHLVGLLEGIVLQDAAGRVARYLLKAMQEDDGPEVRWPSRKKHIASHLNITSETLSRTLRQLRESGFIEEGEAGRLVVLDPEGLLEVAEGLFPKL